MVIKALLLAKSERPFLAEEIVKTFPSWQAGGSLGVSRTAIELEEFPELKCFYTDVGGTPFVSRRG